MARSVPPGCNTGAPSARLAADLVFQSNVFGNFLRRLVEKNGGLGKP